MFSRVLWKRVKCRARGILIRLAPFPLAVWSGPFSTAVWHKASSLACRATFRGRAFGAGSGAQCGALRAGARGWHSPAALKHTAPRWRGEPMERRGSCGFAHKLHKSQRKTIVPQSQADSLRHRAVFVSLHSRGASAVICVSNGLNVVSSDLWSKDCVRLFSQLYEVFKYELFVF